MSSTEVPRRAQLLEQPRTVRRPTGSSALVGSSSSSSGGAPTSACAMPEALLHALRHLLDPALARVAEADQLEQLGALGSSAREPERRWCSSSSSSAEYQPGKRKSSAR